MQDWISISDKRPPVNTWVEVETSMSKTHRGRVIFPGSIHDTWQIMTDRGYQCVDGDQIKKWRPEPGKQYGYALTEELF
jgi:hypothetical protein